MDSKKPEQLRKEEKPGKKQIIVPNSKLDLLLPFSKVNLPKAPLERYNFKSIGESSIQNTNASPHDLSFKLPKRYPVLCDQFNLVTRKEKTLRKLQKSIEENKTAHKSLIQKPSNRTHNHSLERVRNLGHNIVVVSRVDANENRAVLRLPSLNPAKNFIINGKLLPSNSPALLLKKYPHPKHTSSRMADLSPAPFSKKALEPLASLHNNVVEGQDNPKSGSPKRKEVTLPKDGDIVFEPFHSGFEHLGLILHNLAKTAEPSVWSSMNHDLNSLKEKMKQDSHVRVWMRYSVSNPPATRVTKEVEGIAIYALDPSNYGHKRIEILHLSALTSAGWGVCLKGLVEHIWTKENSCHELTLGLVHLADREGKLAVDKALCDQTKAEGFRWKSLSQTMDGGRHTIFSLKKPREAAAGAAPFRWSCMVTLGNRVLQEASLSNHHSQTEQLVGSSHAEGDGAAALHESARVAELLALRHAGQGCSQVPHARPAEGRGTAADTCGRAS